MRRTIRTGERLSSPWLYSSRPRASESRLHVYSSTTRHRVLDLTGRTRPVSSLSSSSHSQPLSSPRHQRRRETHPNDTVREFNTGNNNLGASVVSTHEALQPEEEPDDASLFEADAIFPTWESPEQEHEYAEKFIRVLENGQPDQVMKAMTDPRSAGLVGSLPQTVFLEALHLLSPTHFVEPFRDLHHPIHSWAVLVNGLRRVEEVFDTFVSNLFTVTRYRTVSGQTLQLGEFTHLLDCARAMGNGVLADQVWDTMAKMDVIPDTVCYNHYMEAKIWDHCYAGREAYRMRVSPQSYRKRRSEEPVQGWQGFGTAQRSVRKFVLRIFGEMQAEGHLGDERTYINLFLAAARVGHDRAMKHILKEVWNIDAEALKLEPDNSKLPPVTPYDPWSALHPTENLLFAVAHGLGVNNDIAGAIRTVQFIASSYNIPIPAKVWHELFERAYVLSRQRWSASDTAKTENYTEWANTIGRVSVDLVRSVFETMTSDPYNVTPTLQEWRFMINTSIDNGRLEDCKDYIRGAYNLLEETRKKQAEARALVMRCLAPALEAAERQMRQGATMPDPELFRSPILAEAIQTYDIVRLEVWQQVYLLQRILFLVLRVPSWKDISDKEWHLQERPKMLEEWTDFVPSKIQLFYGEETGFIDMVGAKGFGSRSYKVGPKDIPVRRQSDQKDLFDPGPWPAWDEQSKWNDLVVRHFYLDRTAAPLDRLFKFQLPQSAEFYEAVRKMRNTWTEYPEDHELSTNKNPHGGFYGRLAALGMLKPRENNSVFLLDDQSWI
ncbi:uncharacterized protein N7458_012177 [Penicillium daleae]|uniref:Uncharacterized protein n=1 Tax=Penicillium daleae TaxID=63821 RepID=A0AAD6FWQ8_9EURO|nr:uncharacterized protein N7458_012177 [Penicillium daleae]KAJ5433021.1 hypothetical protein N7458_012177 [Penicillium daleae]